MKLEGRRESTNVEDRRGKKTVAAAGGIGLGGIGRTKDCPQVARLLNAFEHYDKWMLRQVQLFQTKLS